MYEKENEIVKRIKQMVKVKLAMKIGIREANKNTAAFDTHGRCLN